MIKKYIFIACFSLCSALTWGQVYFGVNYSFDNPNKILPGGKPSFNFIDMSIAKIKNRYSTWEIFGGYEISKPFSLETGIRWNYLEYAGSFDMGGSSGGGYLFTSVKNISYENKYLTFPLLMNFHHKMKDGMMYIKIGPQFSYLRSAKCTVNNAGGYVDFDNTTARGGTYMNPDEQTVALGYSFRDKFKTIVPEVAFRVGITFSLIEDVVMGEIGYSYERSLTCIEDMNAMDNLGRKLNRFTNLGELNEGPMTTTYYSKHYFYFGISFHFGYDQKL